MKQRNWLDLTRKLVDRYDMNFTMQGVQAYLGEQALNFFGEGVLITSLYPNPFPITMSGVALGGQVGPGIGFDPNGQITRIDAPSPTSKTFTITAADPSNPRFDLLVIRYKQTGDTPIPKPSDPISTVFLNLHDDFELAVIPGTPAGVPVYPAKGSLDIILAGLQVPAGATLGTAVAVDLNIRELAIPDIPKYPVIRQEAATGVVDGSNTVFTLSLPPLNAASTVVLVDGTVEPGSGWSLAGNQVTFTTAPAPGQQVYVWYIAGVAGSTNPLAGQQEIPGGTVDGVNATFTLVGAPADRFSMIVWVDGVILESSKWSLVQTPGVYKIVFDPSAIPAVGQTLYCFYLANPATVGVGVGDSGSEVSSLNGLVGALEIQAGPGIGVSQVGLNIIVSATGGAVGGYVPHGTDSLPVLVNPAVPLPIVSAEQRALWFTSVAGGSGASPITASPQIAPGVQIGQELMLTGSSDADYLVLQDGNGLLMNGSVNLKLNASIEFYWSGTVWKEKARW
jgi:hypothetical protein